MSKEDSITVLTVENCSRLQLTWSVMLMFTLVQSRSHVDTVQNVSDGEIHWSHICWSRTMKELGSRVTFARWNSASSVTCNVQRHEGVKPYVCDECSKCFCTSGELRRHQVLHSDVKKFCCGFCGKDFKRPQEVKRHYRRCRDVTEFDYMLWGCLCTLCILILYNMTHSKKVKVGTLSSWSMD